ncbi:ankyrin repeat [Fusarium mundagurra]|uniref:Ankyrin repeat n=1 Tax=Fusarium mundagurra TaxID=1567541 RepID=A0A8H5YME2_9HYPO|nr:ankyrin repeat [Fusarium mundagurra]
MCDYNKNTVGWICAVLVELVAAIAVLDKEHLEPDTLPLNDNNVYSLGEIKGHNVVIAALPCSQYGIASAARVAADMLRSFPNVRIGLMVGIGGGVPTSRDIRLGDIVVSVPGLGNSGLYQYDHGKAIQGQGFVTTGTLNQAPTFFLTAATSLKAEHELKGNQIAPIMQVAIDKFPSLSATCSRPSSETDRLYQTNHLHVGSTPTCGSSCDPSRLVQRPARPADEDVKVHYDLIASADQLMKDAIIRDRLSKEKDVLCFKMKAAGLSNHFPCIVIRGICDYADSHKNDKWQPYAALAAAAYAKKMLLKIPPQKVEAERNMERFADALNNTIAPLSVLEIRSDAKKNIEILTWLCNVDYALKHNDIISGRQSKTGHWFLDSETFQTWVTEDNRTLFCPGNPGAGKTYISSLVIDHVNSLTKKCPETCITYVYCDYKQGRYQKPDIILSCLVKQLVGPRDTIPKAIDELYESHKSGQTTPTFVEISQAFKSVVDLYSKVFIFIDALDEFEATVDDRTMLLEAIFQGQYKAVKNIFITSRPGCEPAIRSLCGRDLSLNIAATKHDVSRYIHWKISQAPELKIDVRLRDEITSIASDNADGMFLLVALQIRDLLDQPTIGHLRQTLKNLNRGIAGINERYKQQLQRIERRGDSFRNLVYKVLAWMMFAKRSLTMLELRHAVSVQKHTTAMDLDFIPSQAIMESLSAGFMSFATEDHAPRLIHLTAHDFLRKNLDKWFPKPQDYIFRTCATYLGYNTFQTGPCPSDEDYKSRVRDNPLYEYAAQNWGYHAADISLDPSEQITFLSSRQHRESSIQALMIKGEWRWSGFRQKFPTRMTNLHLAAHFGILSFVKQLMLKSSLLNQQDSDEKTALWYAAQQGTTRVVELLVRRKRLLANLPDGGIDSPLRQATRRNDVAIVKLLLQARDINVNYPWDDPPLFIAAEEGYEAIAKLLLNTQDIDPDGLDGRGYTPLFIASMFGHTGIVRRLLRTGKVDVEPNDARGGTAFTWAVRYGHVDVFKLLLRQKGIDFNCCIDGRTPLGWAVYENNEVLFFLLLKFGQIDIEQQHHISGNTASSLIDAIGYGNTKIFKILFTLPGVDFNRTDADGGTPLMHAVQAGQYDIVKQLLGTGKVDIGARDDDGRSAMNIAEEQGSAEITQLLLEYHRQN